MACLLAGGRIFAGYMRTFYSTNLVDLVMNYGYDHLLMPPVLGCGMV